MKKIILAFAAMLALSVGVQAQEQSQLQGSNSTSGSIATSQGGSSQQGQSQGISNSGNSSAGISGNTTQVAGGNLCIGSCVDQTAAQKDANATALSIAEINAKVARDVVGTAQVIKNTPSVSGPALTASNDTCMGSTSGSVNIAGLGLGGGSSWVDGNCKMLKNSRELWNMGMKAAALALMCTDSANREALELTGFVCPQTERDQKANLKSTSTLAEPTDPFVRARMGLTALN